MSDDDRELTRGELLRLKDHLYPPHKSDDEMMLCDLCDGEGFIWFHESKRQCQRCQGSGEVYNRYKVNQ